MKFLRNAATLFILTKIYCSNIVTFKLDTMHPYSSRGYKMAGGQKKRSNKTENSVSASRRRERWQKWNEMFCVTNSSIVVEWGHSNTFKLHHALLSQKLSKFDKYLKLNSNSLTMKQQFNSLKKRARQHFWIAPCPSRLQTINEKPQSI